ncbi:hypothetical protein LJC58_06425 [Lachnospiraceae bacterium OttesenSCG-928-D06]|nr:hypothetical protein [Lachnospiraceae bacterium OttesenSCG-928-D06]
MTFDFDDLLLNVIIEDDLLNENGLVVCVEAEIENCGNGIITGLDIKGFFIQSGNKVSINEQSEEEIENLFYW